MSVLNTVRVIIYRMHEKGVEIFLIPNQDTEEWFFIHQQMLQDAIELNEASRKIITLDPIEGENGEMINAVAIEGDWHDIPSIRTMLKTDMHFVKNKIEHKIEQVVPGVERGTYFAMKEAFKKLMPQEYAFLKELKEIIIDRNLVQNM